MDSELTVCSNVVARCSRDLHPGCAYMTSLRETETEKDTVILREMDSVVKVLTIIFKILDFEVFFRNHLLSNVHRFGYISHNMF